MRDSAFFVSLILASTLFKESSRLIVNVKFLDSLEVKHYLFTVVLLSKICSGDKMLSTEFKSDCSLNNISGFEAALLSDDLKNFLGEEIFSDLGDKILF